MAVGTLRNGIGAIGEMFDMAIQTVDGSGMTATVAVHCGGLLLVTFDTIRYLQFDRGLGHHRPIFGGGNIGDKQHHSGRHYHGAPFFHCRNPVFKHCFPFLKVCFFQPVFPPPGTVTGKTSPFT